MTSNQERFEAWALRAHMDLRRQNGATEGDLYISEITKWAWIGYQHGCLDARRQDETTPFLFPQLSPLGKDCGQGSGHVAVKLLTTNDGTAHACEKCSTMWFVPYGAAVKASERRCQCDTFAVYGVHRGGCPAENGEVTRHE